VPSSSGGAAGGGAAATGGSAGAGGSQVTCPRASPTFSFVEGFEGYADGTLGGASGSPWIRLSASRTGAVNATWPHGGEKAFEVTSFTTSTEVDYVPLEFTSPPARIDVELWYTPDGFFVYKDFADFGLGFASSQFALARSLTLRVRDHDLLFVADGTAQRMWDAFEYGSGSAPVATYVRVELDLCAGEARVFAGADAAAPLRGTATFQPPGELNAFFVAGGLNPTHFDDIVISTPGSPIDRTPLLGPPSAVQAVFDSPGSGCLGLGWDGQDLWFLDDLDRLYQLDAATGVPKKTLQLDAATERSDLAWKDGVLYVGTYGGLQGLDSNGVAVGLLPGLYYWSFSGHAWDGQHWWVGDYNSWTIHKHAADGREVLKWSAGQFEHPAGIASDGVSIWTTAGSSLAHYLPDGTYVGDVDLGKAGVRTGGRCIEWDGASLWYSAGFKLWKLAPVEVKR
jgi:hypothetical protein